MPDYIHSPLAIYVRFGDSRERRPFHAKIGAAAMRFYADLFTRRFEDVAKLVTYGMRERNMPDDAFAEECRFLARARVRSKIDRE
jgi:hypothetical protein